MWPAAPGEVDCSDLSFCGRAAPRSGLCTHAGGANLTLRISPAANSASYPSSLMRRSISAHFDSASGASNKWVTTPRIAACDNSTSTGTPAGTFTASSDIAAGVGCVCNKRCSDWDALAAWWSAEIYLVQVLGGTHGAGDHVMTWTIGVWMYRLPMTRHASMTVELPRIHNITAVFTYADLHHWKTRQMHASLYLRGLFVVISAVNNKCVLLQALMIIDDSTGSSVVNRQLLQRFFLFCFFISVVLTLVSRGSKGVVKGSKFWKALERTLGDDWSVLPRFVLTIYLSVPACGNDPYELFLKPLTDQIMSLEDQCSYLHRGSLAVLCKAFVSPLPSAYCAYNEWWIEVGGVICALSVCCLVYVSSPVFVSCSQLRRQITCTRAANLDPYRIHCMYTSSNTTTLMRV